MSSITLELKPSPSCVGYSLYDGESNIECIHHDMVTFGDGFSTYFFDQANNGHIVVIIHYGLDDISESMVVINGEPMLEAKDILEARSIDFTTGFGGAESIHWVVKDDDST